MSHFYKAAGREDPELEKARSDNSTDLILQRQTESRITTRFLCLLWLSKGLPEVTHKGSGVGQGVQRPRAQLSDPSV